MLIENRIGAVFVPVSDMVRSIDWYSRLFDLPLSETTHEGRIYSLAMQDDTLLMLDGHQEVTNSSQPLCFFYTTDIWAAHNWLLGQGVEIVGEVADIGSLFTLTFRDPDRNLLMICQRKN